MLCVQMQILVEIVITQEGLVLETGLDHHFGSGYGSEPNWSQIGGQGHQ